MIQSEPSNLRIAAAYFIGGTWGPTSSETGGEIVDPATELPLSHIAYATGAHVTEAVAAARRAFQTFSTSTRDDRLALMHRIRASYVDHSDQMAQVISAELGCPIDRARSGHAAGGLALIDDFIVALEGFQFDTPLGADAIIVREPIGVCALITPWNWPMVQIVLKVMAALAAGCTMVLKPSELTPFSANLFARIMETADVPAGVFNLVHGPGATIGKTLVAHPDVDLVSFTGSTRAGSIILAETASSIKKVALELGGKSPNLLFADCDLEAAVTACIADCFDNSGQSCDAPTRMYVEAAVYEKAVAIATRVANAVAVGLPSAEGEHIGPVISQAQFSHVQALIAAGVAEGARVLAGGPDRPEGMTRGYYVRPTVFADVTHDMRISRDEVFGPVLIMAPFQDEADAIRLANDTPYGLAAYVQSADMDRAERVARKLRAGMVRINGADIPANAPFGGYKNSGLGREGGHLGIEEFTEVKTLAIPAARPSPGSAPH